MTTRPRSKDPIIAIIGPTGSGKSDLAVSLAERYNGEIINGDAMQLYAGLPIITNKISPEEQRGIPHHLLGCIGLHEQTWVVGTFVTKALEIIKDIRQQGKLPILVGGTHYYTQSLLFHDRLADGQISDRQRTPSAEVERKKWPILEQPTEVLLEELQKIDPVMAGRWHPNDRRKIQRSLEIYLTTGKKASEVYAEQRAGKTKTNTSDDAPIDEDGELSHANGSTMRSPTLLFWLHAETEALRARLNRRVDKMLTAGLLEEVGTLDAFARAEAAQDRSVDETRGIWVSIGYKEFKPYIRALYSRDVGEAELEKLKAEATERTKIATRQYAKRQIRWIRIKLMSSLISATASDKLYLLDGTDIDRFDQHVVRPALDLTRQFLQGSIMPAPSSLSAIAASHLTSLDVKDLSAAPEKWTKQHCEVCGVTCVVEEQWMQHIKSRTHRRLVSKQKAASATIVER